MDNARTTSYTYPFNRQTRESTILKEFPIFCPTLENHLILKEAQGAFIGSTCDTQILPAKLLGFYGPRLLETIDYTIPPRCHFRECEPIPLSFFLWDLTYLNSCCWLLLQIFAKVCFCPPNQWTTEPGKYRAYRAEPARYYLPSRTEPYRAEPHGI